MGNVLPRGKGRRLKSDDMFLISSISGRSVNSSSFARPALPLQPGGSGVLWCRSWVVVAAGMSPGVSGSSRVLVRCTGGEPGCANIGAGGHACPMASRAPSPWGLCRGCCWDGAAPRDALGRPGSELSSPLPTSARSGQSWSTLPLGFRDGPWQSLALGAEGFGCGQSPEQGGEGMPGSHDVGLLLQAISPRVPRRGPSREAGFWATTAHGH